MDPEGDPSQLSSRQRTVGFSNESLPTSDTPSEKAWRQTHPPISGDDVANAQDDDWKSDDLDGEALDEETRQRRIEQHLRKKERIKQQMRLKREVTVVKKPEKKNSREEPAKEVASREPSAREPAVAVREPPVAAREPSGPAESQPHRPLEHHLSTVQERSSSNLVENESKESAPAAEEPRRGILKSREPSAQAENIKRKKSKKGKKVPREGGGSGGSDPESEEILSDEGEEHKSGAPVRSNSFQVTSSKPRPKKPSSPAVPLPPIEQAANTPIRTFSRGMSVAGMERDTLRKISTGPGLKQDPVAPKKKKSFVSHLIFSRREHPHSALSTPAIGSPPPVLHDDHSPFPTTPAKEKESSSPVPPKLSLISTPSTVSMKIPETPVDSSRATLTRDVVDGDLL